MYEQGTIDKFTSPWCSPVVLVQKDGTTRFCVDYHHLNNITVKDSFPLPLVDSSLDALNGSQWFSTLDLKSGYWQVELEESAKNQILLYWERVNLDNLTQVFERLRKLSTKKCC